ncbi:MAG: ATP-dependent DNA helicase [Alphaproteobacteria bacterium]|nr:ATP-dependent DNA helicase [Alphaproteobacteria bacterium]
MSAFFPFSLSFNAVQACCFNLKNQKSSHVAVDNLKTVFASQKFLVCNKKSLMNVCSNLNFNNALDIIELILLLFPKISCSPNVCSIYKLLTDSIVPKTEDTLENQAKLIGEIIEFCSKHLQQLPVEAQEELYSLCQFLKEDDWAFADFVLANLPAVPSFTKSSKKYLRAWELIKEFKEDNAAQAENSIDNTSPIFPIAEKDVLNQLHLLTAGFGKSRNEQAQYSSAITNMFNESEVPNFVFAEAGTGTGKTLGYLAVVLSFIKENPAKQVLISTYSKALQKQIMNELKEFIPMEEFSKKVASIKGSNNYLCLLNYKNLLDSLRIISNSSLFLAIISRWVRQSDMGDLVGGDLSPLAFEIFPNSLFNVLLNKKEECLYSKCPHFKNCFIMAAQYKARQANIVISNHAFSLLKNCLNIPYVIFDEAHHLFTTADDIFSTDISCSSGYFLKSWIFGSSAKMQSKKETNGMKSRLNTLLKSSAEIGEEEQQINIMIESYLDAFIASASILADMGSVDRIASHLPKNVMEEFLYQLYLHVLKNNDDLNQYYTLEAVVDYHTFSADFITAIANFKEVLEKIINVGAKLHSSLRQKTLFLKDEDKSSLEGFMKIFESLCLGQILEYSNMLAELEKPDSLYIYRFIIEKEEGNAANIGLFKNYVDPAQPFATSILAPMRGVSFTSATLSDSYSEMEDFTDINRFGLNYLDDNFNINTVNIKSPFNYQENSKIIILNASTGNLTNLSNYILEIFKASNGGGLALFTAITRLRGVYKNINQQMAFNNLPLLAQHVNNQKIANLIDIFKDDINSCMLGTDATRDGIDVPGESLRLVIFEKIPWPKPDILLKNRVEFLGKDYVNKTIRLKLRQAFGRIIRCDEDRGIFVLLQNAVPSEFLKAFPQNIEVKKIPIEETLHTIKLFFNNKNY